MEFPIGNYDCWFDYSVSQNPMVDYEYPIYNWKLIIGNNFVQKTITQQITRDPMLERIKIIGYYKSPFENRIAIFVSETSSYSGDVFYTPRLFGCNMSIGFN